MIKSFARNTAGRDFAVGDIHGHFTRLNQALMAVDFNPAVDRLFSCGDLVDRGPESHDVLEWLERPWFHPVCGNHDSYVARFDSGKTGEWLDNGGLWFRSIPPIYQAEYSAAFRELPIAIEIETAQGLIGIVHGDCPFLDWGQLQFELTAATPASRLKTISNTCMWSRSRFEFEETHGVQGLRALVVGHNTVRSPVILGNVYHIDTGGWLHDGSGHFTLLNLATLQATPAIQQKLQWEAA